MVFFLIIITLLTIVVFIFYKQIKQLKQDNEKLKIDVNSKIKTINLMKSINSNILNETEKQINQQKLERVIGKKLNETDWRILTGICKNPFINNKELTNLTYLSLEGTSSSLRKMYKLFNIEEKNYKKIALRNKIINICKK